MAASGRPCESRVADQSDAGSPATNETCSVLCQELPPASACRSQSPTASRTPDTCPNNHRVASPRRAPTTPGEAVRLAADVLSLTRAWERGKYDAPYRRIGACPKE